MSKKQVAIMVVAQGLPDELVDRFSQCIHKSKPKVSYDIHILRTNDPDQKKAFNKSKLLNKGIKKYCNGDYEVVIQTDIDLIIPPKLVDVSYERGLQKDTCFHVNHRRTTPHKIKGFPKLPEGYDNIDWEYILSTPWESAIGCWNALNNESWYKTGGFNEMCKLYAKEDDDWGRRSKIYGGIKWEVSNNKFPLIHFNHPQRHKNNRRHNNAVIKKCIDEGKINWL